VSHAPSSQRDRSRRRSWSSTFWWAARPKG
jgi:hypothetical protein